MLLGVLETPQVDLPDGPWGDDVVDDGAGGLGVVGDEVLDGGSHPLGLGSVHLGSPHHPGHQGIFGEVFEAAPIERVTLNVHTGGKPDIQPVLFDLVADGGPHLLDQARIPGRRQQSAHREGGAIEGACFPLPGRRDAHPGGAIGQLAGGDVEPGVGVEHAADVAHAARYVTLEVVDRLLVHLKAAAGKHVTRSHQHAQLFVVGHFGHHAFRQGPIIGIVLDHLLRRRRAVVVAPLSPKDQRDGDGKGAPLIPFIVMLHMIPFHSIIQVNKQTELASAA
ncbi:hypothetical protein D3C84_495690 [compost metagenome]